jgi:uncharacterized protein YbjT (DUF2867 family)
VDVVIAGGHGQIARILTRALHARGDSVRAIVRRREHLADVETDGAQGILADLEDASVDQVADAIAGADAVVFAAGAGPGSGIARKDTVDRAASVLTADAAESAGVRRFVQISSMGTETVRDGAEPAGGDEVFVAYLRAKAAAEDDLRRRENLDSTILRPGRLTDQPGTGMVTLAPSVPRGSVPRSDVADTLVALLDEPATAGATLELVAGDTPLAHAVRDVVDHQEAR